MSGDDFSRPVASYDASGLSFPQRSSQHQPTPTTITSHELFGTTASGTNSNAIIRNPTNTTSTSSHQQHHDHTNHPKLVEPRPKSFPSTTNPRGVVLHQGTSKPVPNPAIPEVTVKEGLAANRRERRSPQSSPIAYVAAPSPTNKPYDFVSEDPSQAPSRPAGTRFKRTDGPRDAKRKLQIKERGDTCSYCHRKKKVCDAAEQCHRCVTDGQFCFRGIEQLWLWKAVGHVSLQRGSRKAALEYARRTTFEQSDSILPTLPYVEDLGQHEDSRLIFYLTSSPNNPEAMSYLPAPIGELKTILESRPHPEGLLHHFDVMLSSHVPDPFVVDIANKVDGELRDLLAYAIKGFRIFSFIAGFNNMSYHATIGSLRTARHANLFLIRFCARALLHKIEPLVGKLRLRLRSTEKQRSNVRLALGVYWRIVAGLEWLCATSAFDLVLQDLLSRTADSLGAIEALDRDQFDQEEDLPSFVHRRISTAAALDHLHVSHEFVDQNGLPITSGDARSMNPFAKDFTILMHKLLVYNGNFWTDLHPSVESEVGLWEPVASSSRLNPNRVRDSATGNISTVAGPRSQPISFPGSPDPTVVALTSNASTTVCGSPADDRIAASHVDQPQLSLEDDDRNLFLMYTHIGLENELKRTLSPILPGSTRGSPTRKRVELHYPQNISLSSPTPGPANDR